MNSLPVCTHSPDRLPALPLVCAGEGESIVKTLTDSAKDGNIESLKALMELGDKNRYHDLINMMDDDEYSAQDLPY